MIVIERDQRDFGSNDLSLGMKNVLFCVFTCLFICLVLLLLFEVVFGFVCFCCYFSLLPKKINKKNLFTTNIYKLICFIFINNSVFTSLFCSTNLSFCFCFLKLSRHAYEIHTQIIILIIF